MQYNIFGNTELRVSEIGFGAWAIGGPAMVGNTVIGWGPSDDEESRLAISAALEAGINFFDTADFYGLGHSEKLLGEVLGNRQDVIIATKVGQKVGDGGQIAIDYSKDYVIQACEASLRRLKRDAIDYYQLHVARLSHLEQGECVEAMQKLQQQGKIKYWGASLLTFAPEPEASWFIQNKQGHGFQLVLNLINQLAQPVLQKAGQAGYGIIARMPLQFGLLSGHIKPGAVFDAQDHRHKRLPGPLIQMVTDVLRTELLPIAKECNTNLAGLALSFVLGNRQVSTVIPGMRNAAQVRANTQQLVKLSASQMAYLQQLYHTRWQPVMSMLQILG